MKKIICLLLTSLVLINFVNAQRKERKSQLGGDSTSLFTSNGLARDVNPVSAYNHNGKDYIVEYKDGKVTVWEIVRCYPQTYRLKMVGNPIPVSLGSRKSTANYITDALNDNE